MSDHRIATRYSKSLHDIAVSDGVENEVYDDVNNFAECAEQSPELMELLRSPIIGHEKKSAVLRRTFSQFNDRTLSFFDMVVNKKRESHLVAICTAYMALHDEARGIARATVTSAIPLSDEVMDNIRRYLKGAVNKEDIRLKNIVDRSVIGGMVVRYEDKLLDLSVANELKEIRKTLVYN